MTDKALEAAHAAYAKTVGGVLDGHPMANAISAYLSALPGEAEVVFIGGETTALIERLKASAAHCEMINAPYAASACREAADALQAMQARAEAAERERDEARTKALKEHGRAQIYLNAAVGWERRAEAAEEANKALMAERTNLIETKRQQIGALTTRAEAAEARVKELEEALNHIDALDPEEHLFGVSHDACRGLIARMGGKARAALKGGSNG